MKKRKQSYNIFALVDPRECGEITFCTAVVRTLLIVLIADGNTILEEMAVFFTFQFDSKIPN